MPASSGQFEFGKIALLVVLPCLVYLPALGGGFLWDDDLYLTQAPLVKASDGLYRFWFTSDATDYYPVSNSTFWIEWRLWGMNSTGYHITNLLLHVASVLLVWRILREMSVAGSYLAALLFAVHPVNVEAVAWIAQRKDVLAVFFFLLSIWWFQRDEQRRDDNGISSKASSWQWYWLSLFAFVLAMLSKGSVAIEPIVLLGLVVWRRRLNASDWLRAAPYFAVAGVLTLVNIATQNSGETIRIASFAERLAGAGAAVWFYLSKALLPIELVFIYPLWNIRTQQVLWWLPVFAAAVVTVLLWLFGRGRQATWPRAVLFAWVFFCLALAPVLGFADFGFLQYSLVADHYQHIAILAIAALVAAACAAVYKSTQGATRFIAGGGATMVVGALALMTWQQCWLYGDAITLYEATLKKNSESSVLHYNLGVQLQQIGSIQDALDHYRKAAELKPNFVEAQNNLGTLLCSLGRLPEGIECLQRSLQVKPSNPVTHYNLGKALSEMQRTAEAVEHLQEAVHLKPDYAEAWANLAAVYGDLNRWSDAQTAAEKAIELARKQGMTELAQRIEAWRAENQSRTANPASK